MKRLVYILLVVIYSLLILESKAQVNSSAINDKTNSIQHGADSTINKVNTNIEALSNKWLSKLKNKYSGLHKNMEKSNLKMLKRMQKQELAIQKKLASKDSVAAKASYANFQKKYGRIKRLMADSGLGKTNNIASLNNYVPGMDSLQTTMKYLKEQGVGNKEQLIMDNGQLRMDNANLNTVRMNSSLPSTPKVNLGVQNTGQYTNQLKLPADKLANIGGINTELEGIKKQMKISEELNKLAEDRKQQLKGLLGKYDMENELLPMKKQAYYYKQQMGDYKTTLEDKDKIQDKVLGWAKNQDGFKSFMSKNCFLAQLFPNPADNASGAAAALTGLQTRAGVQQQIMQQMGGASNMQNAQGYINQQMQTAQGQLKELKDKLNQQGSNSSNADMPEFKPNSQKTKSFLKRLEYGLNIQSQRPNGLLPVTSDIAGTVGYKLNDGFVVGIGISYKLGWGDGWNKIRLSNQGIGVRNYADYKLFKSFWLTAGWEQNYYPELQTMLSTNIVHYSSWGKGWQESGLLGLTKKYKVGKQQCKLQLLWDFLSYSQGPTSPRVIYRVGYTF